MKNNDEILTREQQLEKALRGLACCIHLTKERWGQSFTCDECPYRDSMECDQDMYDHVRRLLGLGGEVEG